MSDLRTRLEAILRGSAAMTSALQGARGLGLPDAWIVSGAVYQRVFNHLTGRDPDYGIKDYDLFYFDGADLSYEAEDRVIRRAAAAFEPPLRDLVEVRNQARVHLWFEAKFGEPYTPLGSTAEAVERFVSPSLAVGVRLEAGDSLSVIAPFGLDDLFAMRMRPNPARRTMGFERAAAKLRSRWPELKVEPA